jgi:hypothetical protein
VNGLPKWVYDLVIALQQHEDEHGEGTTCLAPVLAHVPADVSRDADAIRRYASMAATDTASNQQRERHPGPTDGQTGGEGAP